jgi:hypothetical protein
MSWHKDIKLDDKNVLTLNYHNYNGMYKSGIESFYTAILNSKNHSQILYMGRDKDTLIKRIQSGIQFIKPYEEIKKEIEEIFK